MILKILKEFDFKALWFSPAYSMKPKASSKRVGTVKIHKNILKNILGSAASPERGVFWAYIPKSTLREVKKQAKNHHFSLFRSEAGFWVGWTVAW
jgi:hypothetical protein